MSDNVNNSINNIDNPWEGIVNNNAIQKQRIEYETNNISREIGLDVRRIQAQSVSEGYHRKASEKKRKETNFRNALTLVVSGALLVAVVNLGVLSNKNKKVSDYITTQIVQMQNEMLNNGLGYQIGNTIVINGNTEQFRKLNIEKQTDVYLCTKILSDEQLESLIRSISYTDNNVGSSTYGQTCYYTSFQQFLNINGYPDKVTFENYMKAELRKQYEIEQANSNEVNDFDFGVDSLNYNTSKGKGGK